MPARCAGPARALRVAARARAGADSSTARASAILRSAGVCGARHAGSGLGVPRRIGRSGSARGRGGGAGIRGSVTAPVAMAFWAAWSDRYSQAAGTTTSLNDEKSRGASAAAGHQAEFAYRSEFAAVNVFHGAGRAVFTGIGSWRGAWQRTGHVRLCRTRRPDHHEDRRGHEHGHRPAAARLVVHAATGAQRLTQERRARRVLGRRRGQGDDATTTRRGRSVIRLGPAPWPAALYCRFSEGPICLPCSIYRTRRVRLGT